ncbi:hypothetical protein JQ617_09985 [Bradyrhizobium sp. KB893862 SZCCT0404]|uniref:hypothetical protein n=1 Tax=Bradyrhizobium sp. KB893862 SZCCT0404 TaxID=2807672 RepID=UPI001BA97E0D|nr:hypothetical protein [Bradyrhizobium sp. KB893862 SZCCT0404]MBR1174283.1 hypothetical protein [Bradyrhizobium sp. KB893862 SZCCT0404]
MAIRQYIADSSAFPAFDLPVHTQRAIRSRLARPRIMGPSGRLKRTAGDCSLSLVAIR